MVVIQPEPSFRSLFGFAWCGYVALTKPRWEKAQFEQKEAKLVLDKARLSVKQMGFPPRARFWDPHKKDYSILGVKLGCLYLGKLPNHEGMALAFIATKVVQACMSDTSMW